jgi:hypothetical protein
MGKQPDAARAVATGPGRTMRQAIGPHAGELGKAGCVAHCKELTSARNWTSAPGNRWLSPSVKTPGSGTANI